MVVHHYVFDATQRMEECLSDLQSVIEEGERRKNSQAALYDLKESLLCAESYLLDYVFCLLRKERQQDRAIQDNFLRNPPSSLSSASLMLRQVIAQNTASQEDPRRGRHHRRKSSLSFDVSNFAERSSTDTLLFRLVVALNLCLVRIDDARFVIQGTRKHDSRKRFKLLSSSSMYGFTAGVIVIVSSRWLGGTSFQRQFHQRESSRTRWLWDGCKLFATYTFTRTMHKVWLGAWMTRKITESTDDLEQWNRQWHHTEIMTKAPATEEAAIEGGNETEEEKILRLAKKRQRLVEYALHDTPKASIWHSQGELRFLMLKRAMDIFYASVGTANKLTGKGTDPDGVGPDWKTSIIAAGAASFYSLTGGNKMASEVTSCSRSARQLIQNAWGMVSLPSIKTLSLQVSKILKGAAVADRIVIAGVSCYVLSKDPAPELAAAIRRFNLTTGIAPSKRRQLSTIIEESEMNHSPQNMSRKFARSEGRYRQRDVIFHLTGGGFFAHIIASDLPYLLDWSAATGAVVICPEYSLLPDHCFPYALDEVASVYEALVRNEEMETIGFEVDRIIVTGESTGANLAASLCIKVLTGSDELDSEPDISAPTGRGTAGIPHNDSWETLQHEYHFSQIRSPDALMLSCAVLNLSNEVNTSSRVIGNADPVLPSGLISAISDAYAPSELGASKKDPLVSPIFVSDYVLGNFPPTLFFASSQDPLLDDSVIFNQRLRNLGVKSELRTVQNMPHAYLGLGTAGFPEAVQVQDEIKDWLSMEFARVHSHDRNDNKRM